MIMKMLVNLKYFSVFGSTRTCSTRSTSTALTGRSDRRRHQQRRPSRVILVIMMAIAMAISASQNSVGVFVQAFLVLPFSSSSYVVPSQRHLLQSSHRNSRSPCRYPCRLSSTIMIAKVDHGDNGDGQEEEEEEQLDKQQQQQQGFGNKNDIVETTSTRRKQQSYYVDVADDSRRYFHERKRRSKESLHCATMALLADNFKDTTLRNDDDDTKPERQFLPASNNKEERANYYEDYYYKWHCDEITSLLKGWKRHCKTDPQAPVLMEALLKRLLEMEQQQYSDSSSNNNNNNGIIMMPLVQVAHYNLVLDGWACAALFDTTNTCDSRDDDSDDDSSHDETTTTTTNDNDPKQPKKQPRYSSARIVGAKRACQVLELFQQTYEDEIMNNMPPTTEITGSSSATDDVDDDHHFLHRPCRPCRRPNAESFDLVLHVACRTLGAWAARRVLAWMEHLYKTGRNPDAQPSFRHYVMVLNAYATTNANNPDTTSSTNKKKGSGTTATFNNSKDFNAGMLAEALLRHMQANGVTPTTLCYNMAIKAWTKHTWSSNNNNGDRGNSHVTINKSVRVHAAQQADRILENMPCPRDHITYASVVSAWAQATTGGGGGGGSSANQGRRRSNNNNGSGNLKNDNLWTVHRAEELVEIMRTRDGLEPNRVVLNALMSAWVKTKNVAAVHRTREILDDMRITINDYNDDDDNGIRSATNNNNKADGISYNTHLHALSVHAVKRHGQYADEAESFLRGWQAQYNQGDIEFGPNTFSYNLVIDAFVRVATSTSSTAVVNSRAVEKALRTLQTLIRCDEVEPDTFSFNQVLSALAKHSSGSTNHVRARKLLDYMESSYASGRHPLAKPNVQSYSSAIQAYAKKGGKEAAEQAESLLETCKQRFRQGDKSMKPSNYCYNSVINCWAKSGEGLPGARKAEALLEELHELQARDPSMRPNIVTYNGVVNAWARSGTRCCGIKAETYLDKMWQLYNDGHKKLQPDDFTYNTVINAISKSQHRHKAQKALRILRRMDKLYTAGKQQAKPNEMTYTAVLNSCALPADLGSYSRRKALDTAIFTLKELQSSKYGKPNQVTYGTFIKAAANLLHDDDDLRREVIERAFKQCCQDGQVGEMVLMYLKQAAPADLYQELLPVPSSSSSTPRGKVVSVRDLPREWRCNVMDRDQWRVRPRRRNLRSYSSR